MDTATVERHARVVELRDCDEWSFEQIGKDLGVTAQRAHQIYRKGREMFPAQRLEQRRAAALRRYGEIRATLWDTANSCGPKGAHNKIRSLEALIRLEDRQAALEGIDSPRRSELTVVPQDAVEAEIRRLEREMAEADVVAGGLSGLSDGHPG